MIDKNITAKEALAKAKYIAMLTKLGKYEYFEGKKLCLPYLQLFNAKGAEISKKYNRRYSPLTYSSLLR